MTPTLTQRILVVDDDTDICQLCSDILIDSGYQVNTAGSGEAGWQMLQGTRHNPDRYNHLITDNHMPKMSGIELIKKLRSARVALPVILASGTMPLDTEWLRLAAILQKSGPLGQSGINLVLKLCLAPLTLPTYRASVATFAIIGNLQLAAILPKPFSVDQLVQTVREVLHTVDQRRSLDKNSIGLSRDARHVQKFQTRSAIHFQTHCFPPLGLLTVAAMLPGDRELRLVDTNVGG